MARQRKSAKQAQARGRGGSLAWDVAPLVVLAGAGVALLQEPGRRRRRDLTHGRGRDATSPAEIPGRG